MANWANTGNVGDPLSAGWQQQNLTWIEPTPGQRWQVYAPAAPAFEGLLRELAASGYNLQSSGGFNYRNIRGGDSLSQHAFGTAIDLNAATNALGQTTTDIPNAQALADKYGLEWGGSWRGRKDPMHFEYKGAQGGNPVQPTPQALPVEMAGNQPAPAPQAANPYADIFAPQDAGNGDNWLMQGLTGQQPDAWLTNDSYSFDALASDFLSGRSPLRRLLYQSLFT